MNPQAVAAVLDLMADDDPAVREPLLGQLAGDPHLLDAVWLAAEHRGTVNPALIDLVVHADAQALVDAFSAADDLESGLWLLHRLIGPRHDHALAGRRALDALACRIPDGANAWDIARFLADLGFAGDRATYDDPRNSLIGDVLERRAGLPIALVALWLLLCRRRGIHAWAVALPGHVVGGFPNGDAEAWVDCFAGARMIDRQRLDIIARAAGETGAGPYLKPASDRALLRRAVRNLVLSWLRRGDKLRATIASAMAAG
jgi:hypothetical protein